MNSETSNITLDVTATGDTQPVIAPKKIQAKNAPKWETEARERVKAGIKKYSKPMADLLARDANEGDTRLLVTDFLCDVLVMTNTRTLPLSIRSRANLLITVCG